MDNIGIIIDVEEVMGNEDVPNSNGTKFYRVFRDFKLLETISEKEGEDWREIVKEYLKNSQGITHCKIRKT